MRCLVSLTDRLRAKAHAAMDKLPGKAGELARKANEAVGRPLADENELEDRRAFASKVGSATVTSGSKTVVPATSGSVAPVIVYHMDKTRRDATKLTDEAEKVLHGEVLKVRDGVLASVKNDDYGAAMSRVVPLKPFVDTFFDKVMVMADDKALRENRVRLLMEISALFGTVADFSKIQAEA